jgi:ribosomal protein L40E
MVRFPEASQRMFKNVFICRKCKHKQRTTPLKVLNKAIICKHCGGKTFRAAKKK